MISKKYIKELGFVNMQDFFDYVVESKINGNYRQTKEFIQKMNKEQQLEFKDYMKYMGFEQEIQDELINIIMEV